MPTEISIVKTPDATGVIVEFHAVATCPHCGNDSELAMDEVRDRSAFCQHCDQEFKPVEG